MTEANAGPLQSKQHFEVLDGLRGIAAISVLIFHFMEIVVPNPEKNFIAHSYLAVDFFFCLSGFVIAYAYDTRLKQTGLRNFFKLRLIRLHPLVIIGSVLGLLTFVFDPWGTLFVKYGIGKTALMLFTSCFMIPYPSMPERFNNMFLLNPPTWSLMWEYIANIIYGLVLVRLSKRWLCVVVALAVACLYYEAYTTGSLTGGWSGDNFLGGGARMFFAFTAGMLAYRAQFAIKNKLHFIVLSLALVGAFVFPFWNKLAWVTDLVTDVIYFPLLIALGAGSTQISEGVKKACRFLGDISYPLYMVHYPFMWLFFDYVNTHKLSTQQLTALISVSTIILLAFAYVILKYVDEPIRKRLRRGLDE